MADTVEITIPVDADAALVLAIQSDCAEIGRLVSQWLRKPQGMSAL